MRGVLGYGSFAMLVIWAFAGEDVTAHTPWQSIAQQALGVAAFTLLALWSLIAEDDEP